MPLKYGFYSAMQGDRVYDAVELSRIFDGIISEGVYPNLGTALAVTPGTGLKVLVGIGRAWFNSTWTLNDSEYELVIEAPHASYNRIDSVVLEMNMASDVRANSLKVIKGTAAASPVQPTLETGPTIFQYRLANILVSVGASSFTPGDISQKVGSEETPYASFAAKASIEDLYSRMSGYKLITPKILNDFSINFGLDLLAAKDNFLVSDGEKWSADNRSGWIDNDYEWSIHSNKTKSSGFTGLALMTTVYPKKAYSMTLDSNLGFQYSCYPVIIESSAGAEAAFVYWYNDTTRVLKVNTLFLTHTTTNRIATVVDMAPKIKTNGDKTSRFTIGDRFVCTQDGVQKYFIIHNVELVTESGILKTVLTLFKGIGNTFNKNELLSNSVITNPKHSHDKFPIGFPASPLDWIVPYSLVEYTSAASNIYNDTEFHRYGNYLSEEGYSQEFYLPYGYWRLIANLKLCPAVPDSSPTNFSEYIKMVSEEFGNFSPLNFNINLNDEGLLSTFSINSTNTYVRTYPLDYVLDALEIDKYYTFAKQQKVAVASSAGRSNTFNTYADANVMSTLKIMSPYF